MEARNISGPVNYIKCHKVEIAPLEDDIVSGKEVLRDEGRAARKTVRNGARICTHKTISPEM